MTSLTKNISTFILSIITWLFGSIDLPLKILMTLMIIDFFTGILKGFYFKKLSSDYGYKGIIKKTSILVMIAVAVMLDMIIGSAITRIPVCYFFVVLEIVSITENVGSIGIKIPPIIKDSLIQIEKQNKK